MNPPTARRCTGAILAGGLATRMQGAAKGLLTISGQPIVERVADALRQGTDSLCFVVGEADVPEAVPDLPRVRDVFARAGPLAGIHAALVANGTDVLVCAWDMPHVSFRLLLELRTLGEQGYDAVIPSTDSGALEPLCAWYAATALPVIEHKLQAGDTSVIGIVGACNARVLPADEVRRFGEPQHIFLNVNSPGDLALARSNLETSAR